MFRILIPEESAGIHRIAADVLADYDKVKALQRMADEMLGR